MLNRLSHNVINRFPLFIVAYFGLQVLVRLVTTTGVVIDESEQMMLTQYVALGYNAQPPLYTWLQAGLFRLLGPGVFALALLKNLFLGLTYFFTYRTARLVSRDRSVPALCAMALLFIPQIVWEAQVDQVHTVLLTTATSASFFFFFRILLEDDLRDYLLIGLVAGCGMLAKYNFVLVAVSLLAAGLCIGDYRKKILRPRLLLAVLTAAVVVAPHALWFMQNHELATSETIRRMHVDQTGHYLLNVLAGSADLIMACLAFILPFCCFYTLFFRNAFHTGQSRPARLLAVYMAMNILFIFLIILLTQTTQIKQRWLQPYLFVFPMFLFLMTDFSRLSRQRVHAFVSTGICIAAFILILIPTRVYLVDLGTRPHRANYPFESLAADIRKHGFSQGTILGEDKFIGGNMRLFFKDSVVITPSIPLQEYRMTPEMLIVWKNTDPGPYLDSAAMSGYRCDTRHADLPFRHSRKFVYDINYRICRIPEAHGDGEPAPAM